MPTSHTPPTTLYRHEPHPHTPQNVNERLAETSARHAARSARDHGATPSWRLRIAAANERIAVWLTKHTGTMLCAYLFAGIGIGSLVGVFTNNTVLAAICGSLSSYFLQLVLLPVLAVGSNVLSRHAELQADEQFHATQRTLHESQQTVKHLDAQDVELLRQTAMIARLIAHLLPADELPDGATAASITEIAEPSAASKPHRASRSRSKTAE